MAKKPIAPVEPCICCFGKGFVDVVIPGNDDKCPRCNGKGIEPKCRTCNGKLTGRRKRYCSDQCKAKYENKRIRESSKQYDRKTCPCCGGKYHHRKDCEYFHAKNR